MTVTLITAAIPSALVLALRAFMGAFSPNATSIRRSALVVYWIVTIRYLAWRGIETLPTLHLTFGVLVAYGFFVLEVLAQQLNLRVMSTGLISVKSRSNEASKMEDWYSSAGTAVPLVDVFIPTYNEARPILEKSVAGALALDYPNVRIWVLDDGRRDWLRKACHEWGVDYVRRKKNTQFKAGNLNHAMHNVQATGRLPDYVAVFDADFCPRTNFLRRTLALFHDERVGVVQTPQLFYNEDPFQYAFRAGRAWPDDLRFLFTNRLRSLDSLGDSLCCGTSFVIRWQALERIGGFPTESVTEDLLTSVKLHRVGYRTVFLDEPLSVGRAPDGLAEHLSQRARWALGLVQIGRGPLGPLKNLPWPGSWTGFITKGLHWALPALMRQAYLWAPISYWYLGWSVIECSGLEALSYVGPLVLQRGVLHWLSQGALAPVALDAAGVLAGPTVLKASLGGLLRPNGWKFKVTDKGRTRDKIVIHWRVARYFLLVLVLTVLGPLYASLNPYSAGSSREFDPLNLWWTWYNTLVVFVALVPCIELPQRRQAQRFAWRREMRIRTADGAKSSLRVLDVSEDGAALDSWDLELGEQLTIHWPAVGGLKAKVVRTEGRRTGVRFLLTADCRLRLTQQLYADAGAIQLPTAWRFRDIARRIALWPIS